MRVFLTDQNFDVLENTMQKKLLGVIWNYKNFCLNALLSFDTIKVNIRL